MLKITIVMLTTAVFAGLLIVGPYESPRSGGLHPVMADARVQLAPGPAQPGPAAQPGDEPVTEPTIAVVAQDDQAPAAEEPVIVQEPVIVVALNDPIDVPVLTGNPPRPQPAAGPQRGPLHNGSRLYAHGGRTMLDYRRAPHGSYRIARRTNPTHHNRRRA